MATTTARTRRKSDPDSGPLVIEYVSAADFPKAKRGPKRKPIAELSAYLAAAKKGLTSGDGVYLNLPNAKDHKGQGLSALVDGIMDKAEKARIGAVIRAHWADVMGNTPVQIRWNDSTGFPYVKAK